jgi:hypothetical protein
MAEQKQTVGFLGMGIMGVSTPRPLMRHAMQLILTLPPHAPLCARSPLQVAMARNLLKSGQFAKVVVWNRTLSKCDELVSEGAVLGSTPAEVVQACDVTYAMLADPAAAEAVRAATGATGAAAPPCLPGPCAARPPPARPPPAPHPRALPPAAAPRPSSCPAACWRA